MYGMYKEPRLCFMFYLAATILNHCELDVKATTVSTEFEAGSHGPEITKLVSLGTTERCILAIFPNNRTDC